MSRRHGAREPQTKPTKACLCVLILILGTLLLGACGSPRPHAREAIDLTIVHTGRVYGEISPNG